MKNKNLSARFIGKFSSIQSVIFATVAVLVLSAVVIVTGVSMKFTNTSIFENSSEYTHTIIQQMNQNIDSYIDYMENIAYLISSNEDVQDYLFDEKIDNEGRYRILNQLQTILDSRSDIRNVGIISKNGRMLINDGSKSVNQDLDLNTQEWYATALEKPNGPILTSSHVQHIISGERPWVITLSRGIRDRSGSGEKEGVFFIDLNYSAISELCDQSTVGTKGYAFILDAKGNIVYHPQQQQLYNELQTENISLIMDTDEDTVLTGTGNDGKLYSISRSEKTGWTVVDCTNVKELLSKSRQAQSVYVLTAIILVIVALLFSRFMARSITLPIQKLRDSMKKVQEGDFSVSDVVVDSKNEIGSLTKSFDVMTHRIHELMEQNVHEQLGLDKILFMPAGNPPHKQNRIGRATDAQRVSMVEKAISGNPHFELSLTEMNDKGFTYTYHTLETLKEQNPDTDYYFIIGADSLYDFSSWREPARICKACTIVVAVRDHVPVEKLNEQMKYLSERYNGRFISLNTLNIDISSQLLRKWHQEGKSLRYYVPDAVADYIDKNHIYHITEGVGHNNV